MFQRLINWFIRTIGIDRLLHFLVEAVIVFVLATYGVPVWIAAVIALAVGILKEIIDAVAGSGADVFDIIADVAGIGFAWLILWSSLFVI